MGDTIGMVKVTVVQGKSLVIRDFKTSDPYVVVRLGTQVAKTKVIDSCLNPTWNEEFTFSVMEPVGALNLEVFDKDRFKSDDEMGTAYISLQQIASAARLKRLVVQKTSGETRIRTVVSDYEDNCLVTDSHVSCIDNEIVQNVRLRLCGVESGEIELKLKWVDLVPSPSK